mmetsp:Transcript_91401/g.133639  ORF Transcript_91401/g.133639 Transcript_91401/m.133639 type:complete len:182 (+) Transcript_91401:238-783(+)
MPTRGSIDKEAPTLLQKRAACRIRSKVHLAGNKWLLHFNSANSNDGDIAGKGQRHFCITRSELALVCGLIQIHSDERRVCRLVPAIELVNTAKQMLGWTQESGFRSVGSGDGDGKSDEKVAKETQSFASTRTPIPPSLHDYPAKKVKSACDVRTVKEILRQLFRKDKTFRDTASAKQNIDW